MDRATLGYIRRSVWVVRGGCVAMVASLFLTACKLAAAYLCEGSMWNVSELFSATRGCLDMEDLLGVVS